MLRKWKYLEAGGAAEEGAGGGGGGEGGGLEEEDDPTDKLLRSRRLSGEALQQQQVSPLKKEMDFYEGTVAMECLKPNGDRVLWWKKHEDSLPLLSKVAKHILGIPCSSSKSERVFSTGGLVRFLIIWQRNKLLIFCSQMVTKKRFSLKAQRVENLIVLKENRKLVEEFMEVTSYQVVLEEDVFKKVLVEREVSEATPARSDAFVEDVEMAEEDVEEDVNYLGYDSDDSDDEFNVVLDD